MTFFARGFNLRRARGSGRSAGVLITTATVCAAMLMVAQADERRTEFTPRVYVGAGVGLTQLEPTMPNASLTVSDENDTGFHGVVGYDFTSRLSAEVYYADLGAAKIAFLGSDVGAIDYQVYGLSGIAYLFNNRSGFSVKTNGLGTREGLSFYTRVGIGGVSVDTELDHTVNSSTHLALGLGVEYGFSNGFSVRGEYRAMDADQKYASISVLKRFGTVAGGGAVEPEQVRTIAVPETTVTPVAPEKPAFIGVRTVNFALDRSEITALAASKLDEVIAAVGDSDVTLMLEGNTDWLASENYNQGLSLRRADSVRRYLESKGISRSRLTLRGYGETRPVSSNTTAEGRAANRRVDIRVN